MNDELARQNEQLKGELSLVHNQKKLLDTMRGEVNQLREHQRKVTEQSLEQEKQLAQKEAILEQVRNHHTTESQEYLF